MATPKKIDLRKATKVKMEFGKIDNHLTVRFDPDGQSARKGIIEFGNSRLGAPNYDTEVDITDMINAYKSSGAKSIFLTVVGSNWVGGGNIQFEFEVDGTAQGAVNVNLPVWTSQQWPYELQLL